MKRILLSVSSIGIILASVVSMSDAFFSDTETSDNNAFVSGSIDLTINGENDPNGLVEFSDLKPGDLIEREKTLRVDTNDAYVWMHIKDIVSSQGIQTEPENVEESINGIQFDLENYLNYNLTLFVDDELQTLMSFDDEITLYEAHSCWVPLGIIPASTNTALTQSFLLPDTVTNWAQGDDISFTEEFYAVQVRNNSDPTPPDTGTGRIWDKDLGHCIDGVSCSETTAYISASLEATQGLKNDGVTPVDANRSIEANVTGAPSGLTNPPEWYSLGFGGVITMQFANPVGDEAGVDLLVHEITGGRNTYPEETATVEVSADNSTWYLLGNASSEPGGDGVSEFDISSNPLAPKTIEYVRITDTTNSANHNSVADGFDLDAIEAVYGECVSII